MELPVRQWHAAWSHTTHLPVCLIHAAQISKLCHSSKPDQHHHVGQKTCSSCAGHASASEGGREFLWDNSTRHGDPFWKSSNIFPCPSCQHHNSTSQMHFHDHEASAGLIRQHGAIDQKTTKNWLWQKWLSTQRTICSRDTLVAACLLVQSQACFCYRESCKAHPTLVRPRNNSILWDLNPSTRTATRDLLTGSVLLAIKL
jgi:hypothetical protein